MRRTFWLLAALLLSFFAGCGYQDFQRPLVRNYAADLFYEPERPPREAELEVRRLEELAEALARWKEMVGPPGEAYTLGPGDVLKLSLFVPTEAEANIAAELEVRGGGTVRCPLVGEVQVAGLTTRQVEQRLAELYGDGYYRNPLISVALSEYGSKQIFMTGALANPGVLSLRANRTTLLEALLEAGGLTEKAGRAAVVTRVEAAEGGLEPEIIRADLARLIEGSDMVENIWIQPGDVIHVPYAEDIYFYVFGFVRAPGAYPLPDEGSIGVMDAIAFARGLSDAALPEKTYLLRGTGEGEEIYRVDLTRIAAAKEPDVILEPGDRIIVRTSWGRRIVDGILHALGLRALLPPVY